MELSLGVLVLGALEPAERPAVETHLAQCPRCTATLAELAPLPGLLHRLDPIEHAPPAPRPTVSSPPQPPPLGPPELRERLVQAARAERARRRRRWAVAAAAVLVGVLLAGQVSGLPWGDDHDKATVASATDARSAVRADVRVTPDDTGSALALRLRGVAPEEHCSLVAVNADGRSDVAATWVASYQGQATVVGHTSFRPDQITRLLVVTEAGRTLVRVPIHG